MSQKRLLQVGPDGPHFSSSEVWAMVKERVDDGKQLLAKEEKGFSGPFVMKISWLSLNHGKERSVRVWVKKKVLWCMLCNLKKMAFSAQTLCDKWRMVNTSNEEVWQNFFPPNQAHLNCAIFLWSPTWIKITSHNVTRNAGLCFFSFFSLHFMIALFCIMNVRIITHKTAVKRQRSTFLRCYTFKMCSINYTVKSL